MAKWSKGYQTCIYVGAFSHLKGKTAMVRPHDKRPDMVLVQFDDLQLTHLGVNVAHNWHAFLKADFKKRKYKRKKGETSWRRTKKWAQKQEE